MNDLSKMWDSLPKTPQKYTNNRVEYYHFKSTVCGERFFKVDRINDKVHQVCLDSGKAKKGRPHCEGIYKLAMSSFMGTYYWYFDRPNLSGITTCKLTTKEEYLKALAVAVRKFV